MKAGTKQVVPFWFYEWSVWKSGFSCLGTQGSKGILGARREQRKCFSLPPSCCQQPGLSSDFGVSLGVSGLPVPPQPCCVLSGWLGGTPVAADGGPDRQPCGAASWNVGRSPILQFCSPYAKVFISYYF